MRPRIEAATEATANTTLKLPEWVRNWRCFWTAFNFAVWDSLDRWMVR